MTKVTPALRTIGQLARITCGPEERSDEDRRTGGQHDKRAGMVGQFIG